MNWDVMLAPYSQVVDELKIKLKGIQAQFEYESRHSPIEFITGRVKPIASIIEKAESKEIKLDQIESRIQDIAGLRIVSQFVDDIYAIVDLIRTREDLKVIEERDYIKNSKESGYRSYHIVIIYPVETIHGVKHIIAEIQIRTLAMNFCATNEHSLNYKYKRSEEHTSELQSRGHLVCRLLLEKKKNN